MRVGEKWGSEAPGFSSLVDSETGAGGHLTKGQEPGWVCGQLELGTGGHVVGVHREGEPGQPGLIQESRDRVWDDKAGTEMSHGAGLPRTPPPTWHWSVL